MEGAGENQEKTNRSLEMNGHSRDLLHKNGGEAAEGEELRLSLGLSMNGTFGVDPACKRLRRSSSISSLVFSSVCGAARDVHSPPLGRACSLPVESEEDFRRRKEEQSARRLEARKKRMDDKKKNGGEVKNYKEDSCEDNASDGSVSVQKAEIGSSQQGSIGSQKSQRVEGSTKNGEVKSLSSLRSVQVEQEATVRANAPDRNRKNELLTTTLMDMPYVYTRGVKNRIDGFLYKYEKGYDLKIVCICHGSFHSPEEFVRHGGGGDVENPLQHIVVNTAPLF